MTMVIYHSSHGCYGKTNVSLDENSEKLYGKSVNFPGTLKPTSFI